MAIKPFEFVKAINFDKTDMFAENDDAEESYVPFIVNKSLSYFPETLQYANEMNMSHGTIPKRQQFDYLRHLIRKGKRFAKWESGSKDQRLNTIMEFYGCNKRTAESYSALIKDEDILVMEKKMNKGTAVNETARGKAKETR